MLKTVMSIIMGVSAAASMAVAGTQINTPTARRNLPDLKIVRVTPSINRRVAGICRTGKKDIPGNGFPVMNFDLTVKNVGRGTAFMDRYGVILSAQTMDFHERVFDTNKRYLGGTGGPGHFQGPHGIQAWALVRMGAIAPGTTFEAHSNLGVGYNNTRFTIARLHELAGQMHRFRIKLTSYGSPGLKESNTSNNEYVVNYTFPRNFCQPPAGTAKQADITSRKGIRIGRRSSRWGGQLNLGGKNTILRISNGKCAFDVYYDMTNAGSAATSPAFVNRLREGTAVVSQQSALHLNAGQTKTIHTQAYLSPGKHIVSLSLDDGRAVAESNEGNNRFRVGINVKSSCRNIGYIRPPAPPQMPPPPKVMPPSPRLRLNRGGSAAPTIRLTSPSAVRPQKKLSPSAAHPKIKLSPPRMKLVAPPAMRPMRLQTR